MAPVAFGALIEVPSHSSLLCKEYFGTPATALPGAHRQIPVAPLALQVSLIVDHNLDDEQRTLVHGTTIEIS